jgi:hypothetical protein
MSFCVPFGMLLFSWRLGEALGEPLSGKPDEIDAAKRRLWPAQPTSGALATMNAGDNLVIAADNSTRYAPVVAR